MRTRTAGLVIAGLLAAMASGQQVDRTFYFRHVDTAQQIQEIATTLRSITDIRALTTDLEHKSMAVHGTAGQVALAEWLVDKLDVAAAPPPGGIHEYRLPDNSPDVTRGNSVIRVFYMDHAETRLDIQELITLVRSVGDVERLFVYSARKAIVLRGNKEQAAVAAWLLEELDKPAVAPPGGMHEYRVTAGNDLVRVYYLTDADNAEQRQEIAARLRSSTGVKRLFIYGRRNALALRGTPEQILAAGRLLQ